MTEHSWTKSLARAALLIALGACKIALAQSASGSLGGRLTDLYSKPLDGASLTLRNKTTGAEVHTKTTKGGVYQFKQIEPGAYTLEILSRSLGQGSMEGIEVIAGQEARVQVAVRLSPRVPQVAAKLIPPVNRPPVLPVEIEAQPEAVPDAEAESNNTAISTSPPGATLSQSAIARIPREGSLKSDTHGSSIAEASVEEARAAAHVAMPPSQTPITAGAGSEDAVLAAMLAMPQLSALPLTSRDWRNFLPDQPAGANNNSANAAETANASIERTGEESTAGTIEGASTRLAFGGASVGHMRGPTESLMGPGGTETSIREVQMNSSGVDVDGDRGEAGRMNIETEHGTDSLHGQIFLYDRGSLGSARNPYTQWVQQTTPATLTTVPVFTPTPYTPSDRETTWGVGAGGHMFRRPIFWFAAVDGLRRDDPGVSTVKHPENFFAQPSNDQAQVLSARLGLSSVNPIAEGLSAYSNMLGTLDRLLGPAARTSSQWTGFGRLDKAVTERHNVTLEGTGALWNSPGGGLTRSSETYGTHSYGSSRADDQWMLGRWEAFLTPNLLVVTQGSVGRQFLTTPAESPSTFEQSLISNAWERLPQMTVDSRYGFVIGNPSRFGPGSYPDEHLYQAQEQLNWVRGGLMLKGGFDFRHNNDATGMIHNQMGTYDYASVENFASDALSFAAFGLNGQLNPDNQHNCDQTGKVWRDSAGTLHGLGYLPCYSWYSQIMGPANWWISTSDWAGFVTSQWQPEKLFVVSLAMRWEKEQSPPPFALLNNPDLPLTEKMPSLGNQWGPRASVAWGASESHWPVLRLGYGMYFGRTPNATFESALTQTGSLKGDLNFFMRPTDNLNAGGAPPFPYVLAGEPGSVVKPGAVEFASGFRNGEMQQAVASIEETMPGQIHIDASALTSLGRRLPVTEDSNIDPTVNPQTITYAVIDGIGSGPLKTPRITVPFYASWPSSNTSAGFAGRLNPNYQQVTEISSRANSTYEAAVLRLTRNSRAGLTFHVRYTYAHTMDWNPNESATVSGPSVFDPTDFREEYGTSGLDVRHSASATVVWEPRWKLHGESRWIANGWMISGIGSAHTGLPYTMSTAGSLATEFDATGTAIVALAPGMNGYGGDNRVYGVGRNTYRYPHTWKADLRLARHFNLGEMRQLELLAESFNLFNHQNVTELETVGYSIQSGSVNGSFPTLNFLTGLKTGQTEFGQPLNVNATDFFRPRQIQIGVRLRY